MNPQTPSPDISKPGFRLTTCDGPRPPDSVLVKDPDFYKTFKTETGHDYVVCNFAGFMQQAQYLINVMIMLGVLVAILGLVYGGWLYVSGIPKNIEKAKSIFPKLAIGFILMITAWFIVSQIVSWLTGNNAYMGSG